MIRVNDVSATGFRVIADSVINETSEDTVAQEFRVSAVKNPSPFQTVYEAWALVVTNPLGEDMAWTGTQREILDEFEVISNTMRIWITGLGA